MPTLGVRHEGNRVLLLRNGVLFADMPWEVAEALGKAMYKKSKLAEETEKAYSISYDQAVLMRAGFPLGLSTHRGILSEAKKTAEGDRDLRRYIPSPGIRSGEAVGTPTLTLHPPPKKPPQSEDL